MVVQIAITNSNSVDHRINQFPSYVTGVKPGIRLFWKRKPHWNGCAKIQKPLNNYWRI